jgi:hypothetical protein
MDTVRTGVTIKAVEEVVEIGYFVGSGAFSA